MVKFWYHASLHIHSDVSFSGSLPRHYQGCPFSGPPQCQSILASVMALTALLLLSGPICLPDLRGSYSRARSKWLIRSPGLGALILRAQPLTNKQVNDKRVLDSHNTGDPRAHPALVPKVELFSGGSLPSPSSLRLHTFRSKKPPLTSYRHSIVHSKVAADPTACRIDTVLLMSHHRATEYLQPLA